MAEAKPVPPVKLLAAIFYNSGLALAPLCAQLEKAFGAIDYRSEPFAFTGVPYYRDEMGDKISRIFISFEKLVDAAELADIKIKTNQIEKDFSENGKRTVNIDAGYLDFDKLVLASMKKNGPKIYLGKGVWADMNLLYAKGHFHPLPWTFLDFADGKYEKVLLRIREIYKRQL